MSELLLGRGYSFGSIRFSDYDLPELRGKEPSSRSGKGKTHLRTLQEADSLDRRCN